MSERMKKDEEILVSVITVSYNAMKTIGQTIESVLGQTYRNIEYIIIDGGSTDGTVEVIKDYVRRTKELESEGVRELGRTIIWSSEPDKGIYDAMNKGIRKATGKLIGIVNADDWYEPQAVETMVAAYKAADKPDESVYYGMLRIWRDEKEYCVRRFHHRLIPEMVVQHPTNFVPKRMYDELGLFNDSYRIAADYELQNRFRIHRVEFVPVEGVISNFRLGGASDRMTKEQLLEMPTIQLKFGMISQEQYDAEYKRIMNKPNLWRRIKRAIKYVVHG